MASSGVQTTRGSTTSRSWRTSGPGARRPFVPPVALDRLQEGEGEQHQGDVVVPASVPGDLVVVEPELALGELEVLLDGPAQAPDPGQRGQRDRLGRVGQEVLEL